MSYTTQQLDQVDRILGQLENQPSTLRNNWCVPREAGRFLHVMALTLDAQRICEVGTSIGYSTLWLAKAARQTGGHVDTLEYFEERQKQAIAHVSEAGLNDVVTFHLGQAIELLNQFQQLGKTFDLAFIDAAKKEYIDYGQLLTPMIRPGGLLIADNTQSHRDEMGDFLHYMEQSSDWDVAELDTPNGQLIARRR